MSDKAVREFLARIGKKGGEAEGASKVRGSPEYYKALSAKAAKARAKKRKGREQGK
jgi:hypothetical protein